MFKTTLLHHLPKSLVSETMYTRMLMQYDPETFLQFRIPYNEQQELPNQGVRRCHRDASLGKARLSGVSMFVSVC